MKFEWLAVRPGIIALSGTPFQIRREEVRMRTGEVLFPRGFIVYEGERVSSFAATLAHAKMIAEDKSRELIDVGLLEDD